MTITSSETATTPRERFREMMRADILSAALDILREGGYTALSMRALADAVGVKAPTLYDYFANKEDVLNALFLIGIAEARAYFDRMASSTPPGAARVIGIGLGYYDFAKANPELFQLIYGQVDANYVPGDEQMEAGHQLFLSFSAEVSEAIASGDFEPTDVDQLTMTLWAALHGVVCLEAAGFQSKCLPGPPRDMSARMVESILSGVRRRVPGEERPFSCPIPPAHPLGARTP